MATGCGYLRHHGSLLVVAALCSICVGFAAASTSSGCNHNAQCEGKTNTLPLCKNGTCAYSCTPGWSNCNGNWDDGCEVNTDSDVFNCGSCQYTCNFYPSTDIKCNKGICTYACPVGRKDCNNFIRDGCEIELKGSDVWNCGACGKKCVEAPDRVTYCNKGDCKYNFCKAGSANCDIYVGNGCECNAVANAVTKCKSNKCDYACKAGWANCDGKWSNGCERRVTNDMKNCGRCNKVCPLSLPNGEAKCRDSKCGQQCKKGYKYNSRTQKCVREY